LFCNLFIERPSYNIFDASNETPNSKII